MGADEVNRIRQRYADPTARPDKGQLLRDVQTLLQEVDSRTTLLVVSLQSNVMCRHRLATTPEEVAEHLQVCRQVDGALVEHVGQMDVGPMLRQGWALDPVVEFLAGKRIRVLHAPTGEDARNREHGQAMADIGMAHVAAVDDTEQTDRDPSEHHLSERDLSERDPSGNPWGESHG